MIDYDLLENALLENLQKPVKIVIDGSQYRKGIFKLFKYYGEYIEIILDDSGRSRIIALPIPFSIITNDDNVILSFKLSEYKMLDPIIVDKILNCFTTRAAKFFNTDVILEWQP